MNNYFYYDPEMDQYNIKRITEIKRINDHHYLVNNHLLVHKDQIKNNIHECLKAIKTSKEINIYI